jgi:cell wall-associated NlpC family hydrolase
VAGFRNKSRWVWLGPLVVMLVALSLTGCSPKRVLRTGPVQDPRPQEDSVSTESSVEYLPDNPPGEPESGLPEPKVRGVTGTSSLESTTTRPPGTPTTQPLTGSKRGFEAATLARKQLGKPYQWGASGPDKFDCSGLVMYVYDNLGVKLPRVSGQQAYEGVHVDGDDLQPGDLVFFKLNGSRIDHVGIYLGNSNFVHAPRKYVPVRTDSLNNSYWRRRFKGGRRLK